VKAAGTKIESKGLTGKGATAETGAKIAKLETCHPSVCVGSAPPTNCICPTTSKK
jgi:hypothetical protein